MGFAVLGAGMAAAYMYVALELGLGLAATSQSECVEATRWRIVAFLVLWCIAYGPTLLAGGACTGDWSHVSLCCAVVQVCLGVWGINVAAPCASFPGMGKVLTTMSCVTVATGVGLGTRAMVLTHGRIRQIQCQQFFAAPITPNTPFFYGAVGDGRV
jgi:hypothetical protein